MEYDSRPSGSSVNPLIMVLAAMVAVVVILVVVYFVVLAPNIGGGSSNERTGNQQPSSQSLATSEVANQANDAAPSASLDGQANVDPDDWRRGFRLFQQSHQAQELYKPLEPVQGDQPDSFYRFFDGNITSAPGHQGYSGLASVYVTPQGQKLLRLHGDFTFQPTPGLTISLSSNATLRAIGDLRAPFVQSMEVGTLDQFKGETFFILPNDLPADALQSVALWSKPYDQLVAYAMLQPY